MRGNPFARLARDKNEPEVVAALRAHGFLVWPIHGQGVPDLLVWSGRGRRFHLVEVKNPATHARRKGGSRRTEAQERRRRIWEHESAPVHEVTTGHAAVALIRAYDDAHRGGER